MHFKKECFATLKYEILLTQGKEHRQELATDWQIVPTNLRSSLHIRNIGSCPKIGTQNMLIVVLSNAQNQCFTTQSCINSLLSTGTGSKGEQKKGDEVMVKWYRIIVAFVSMFSVITTSNINGKWLLHNNVQWC